MSEQQDVRQWSSQLLFIAAAIGSAVGIANIWKFTYIVGHAGGGAFVLIYIAALFCVAMPALIAELLVGRRGGKSVVRTMRVLHGHEGISRAWRFYGVMAVTGVFIALTFYCVVAGWTIDFFVVATLHGFKDISAEAAQAGLAELFASPGRIMFYQAIFIAFTVGIVAGGVRRGLERALKLLTPGLFLMLLVLLIYAMVAGNFAEGLAYLFKPDMSQVTGRVVLLAVGQAFFSLGVGVGVIMTIGAYMRKDFPIGSSAIVIAACDGGVAIIAAMAIFPIVFAYGLSPAEGPGLIFATLPVAFGQMPGGAIIGPLFFLLMAFAALSSSITLLESIIATLEDYTGIARPLLSWGSGVALFVVGLATVFSFNILSDFHPLGFIAGFQGMTLYDLKGFALANVIMPAGGILVASLAGWSLSKSAVREELALRNPRMFALWYNTVRFVVPTVVLLVFWVNLTGN